MNEMRNWDDLRLFLAIARSGGLARAAPVARLSVPTLGRRMLSLERALGTTLFVRHRNGYDLTIAGEELLELSEAVERGALGIDRWCTAADTHPVVKIAAGVWTTMFIARHLSDLVEDSRQMTIEVVSGAGLADLMRREANIGLRNRRPETVGLAGRRLVRVEFANYAERVLAKDQPEAATTRRFTDCCWIAYCPSGPKVPSAVWLDRQLHREAEFKMSTAQAVLAAAVAGVGLCVLPCFVGDAEPRLARVSGVIAALAHDQWLVTHDDDRHNKQIRQVSRRLAELVFSRKRLFGGLLPA